jgi:hypothetical protein
VQINELSGGNISIREESFKPKKVTYKEASTNPIPIKHEIYEGAQTTRHSPQDLGFTDMLSGHPIKLEIKTRQS